MKMRVVVALFALLILSASAEIFFKDDFSDQDGWKSRWVVSDHKKDEGTAGTWAVSNGKFFADPEKDKGLETTQDARFYAISAKTPKEFSTVGKKLILQYAVKHPQSIDCGGGYIKLMPSGLDQTKFNGDSPYNIMFGPDICGSTRRIHAILNHKGENKLIEQQVPCETDRLNHMYTFEIDGENRTFDIRVDGVSRLSGKIEDYWSLLPPRKIPDVSQTKPADWVDAAEIDDPEDKKPEGWDDVPQLIPNPTATKPEDWDDEADGAWEAPKIPNPAYRGEWKPRRIPNPAYKGVWKRPMIDNPDFKDDPTIGQYLSNAYVGFEIWQVRAGTIFSNILITDDASVAEAEVKAFLERVSAEKLALEANDAKEREALAQLDAARVAEATADKPIKDEL